MSIKQLLQQLFVSLAVLTSMGTLVHDTKISRAYALSVPLNNLTIDVTSNLESLKDAASHTHVEKVTVQSPFETPRVQARDDHRRYYLQPKTSRSSDFFGGSRILWPNV
jgi:hypothetical protein